MPYDKAVRKECARTRCSAAAYRPFVITSRRCDRVLYPALILYVESRARVLSIHTFDGCVDTYGQLRVFMTGLPADFVRCHRSFAVNLAFVHTVGRAEAKLVTGERVPVSRSRLAETRSAFRAYVRACTLLGETEGELSCA